jgi:DNA-binding Lrp family transcriptional regulator
MAISAYIFVECTAGMAKDVEEKISQLDGVISCHAITGPVDVIALVESPDVRTLGNFSVSKIQAIPGVIRTETNVIID